MFELFCMRTVAPGQINRRATIYLAETVLKRQGLINEILGAVVLPQLCLISLATLAVWFRVSQGMSPFGSSTPSYCQAHTMGLTPVTVVVRAQ